MIEDEIKAALDCTETLVSYSPVELLTRALSEIELLRAENKKYLIAIGEQAETVVRIAAERDAAVAALTHISKTIGKQLNLIEERAPGKFLDKPAVVSSLKMHKRTCDAAIKGEAT